MSTPRWAARARRLAATLLGAGRTGRTPATTPPPTPPARSSTPSTARGATRAHVALPDHHGPVRTSYAPNLDGDADPGEIVWTWVPFEDDPSRGKDRPVLVVGRDGGTLLALMLTSKDHDRDAAAEARRGRVWMDLGAGPWDARGRPSEVRLDRVLRIDPAGVRREGAILDRTRFDQVVRGMTDAIR